MASYKYFFFFFFDFITIFIEEKNKSEILFMFSLKLQKKICHAFVLSILNSGSSGNDLLFLSSLYN